MSAIYTYWDFEEGMFNIRGIQTRQNVQCQTGKIDDDTGWRWLRFNRLNPHGRIYSRDCITDDIAKCVLVLVII